MSGGIELGELVWGVQGAAQGELWGIQGAGQGKRLPPPAPARTPAARKAGTENWLSQGAA